MSVAPEQVISPQSEEEWLVQFKHMDENGLFAQESDFRWLLRRFETALNEARVSQDPSFDPPTDFESHLPESTRVQLWRSQWRFPEVHRTYLALLTMAARALEGKSPVTRAEWNQLKEWYLSQRHRLPSASGTIELPNGRSLSQSAIDHMIRVHDGIIMDGAETVLADMRLLHDHYGILTLRE